MKKTNIFAFTVTLALVGLASCSHDRSMEGDYDPNDTGYEYAPEGDMYHSVPYDPFSQYEEEDIRTVDRNSNYFNPDTMNMRYPAKGTVARGKMDFYYPYPNTPEGYERAGAEVKNPLVANAVSMAEGKRLYETYCWQCHGMESSPKGSIVAAGKYPPPTWDFERKSLLKNLSDGKMFHSITYGRNLMGPHGPIVSPEQRWMIINYLKTINGTGTTTAPKATDSTQQNSTTQPTQGATKS
ncbi:MAG: c-type cytochrome [Bacteroidia bacterium]